MKILYFALSFGIFIFAFYICAPLAQASIINKPANFLTINSGLVGWWTFDGKNTNWATNITNDTASINHGTMTNMSTTTSQVTGKIGQGLQFDGVNDYVNIGDKLSLEITPYVTVSGWIKLNSLGRFHMIAGNVIQGGTATPSQGYELRVSNANAATFLFGDGGASYISTTTTDTLTTNRWYHLVGVKNSTGIYVYIDGVQKAFTATTASIAFGSNNFYLGQRFTFYTQGSLDDIRIYNRALSAREVRQLYNTGQAKTNVSPTKSISDGLIGWWIFDGKNTNWTTNTTSDTAGTNHGTITNMSTTTSQVTGKIGQGLKFDGSNDYVGLPAFSSPTSLNDWTVSMWTHLNAQNSGAGNRSYLLDLRGNGAASSDSIALYIDGTAEFSIFQHYSATPNDYSGYATTISPGAAGRWVHFVGQRTGTTIKGFVDGVAVSLSLATGVATKSNAMDLTNGGRLGSYSGGTSVQYFLNGSLDDVRIYNRALSAREIRQLYNVGQAKTNVSPVKSISDGLVGYWNFDGKNTNWTTNTTNDTALTNHGTMTNMSTTTSQVTGKTGQGLKFDGSNDYIKVPYNSSLYSTTMSVSFWIKSNTTNYSIIGYPIGMYDYAGDNRVWAVQIRTTNKYSIITSSNGTTAGAGYDETTQSVQLGWHHVTAVTSNTGDTWTFYYDGGSPQTVTDTVAYSNQSSFVVIGGLTDTGYFNGSMDDVRIYNRALSANEVKELYNIGR